VRNRRRGQSRSSRRRESSRQPVDRLLRELLQRREIRAGEARRRARAGEGTLQLCLCGGMQARCASSRVFEQATPLGARRFDQSFRFAARGFNRAGGLALGRETRLIAWATAASGARLSIRTLAFHGQHTGRGVEVIPQNPVPDRR